MQWQGTRLAGVRGALPSSVAAHPVQVNGVSGARKVPQILGEKAEGYPATFLEGSFFTQKLPFPGDSFEP
jgi:hypothetical protein